MLESIQNFLNIVNQQTVYLFVNKNKVLIGSARAQPSYTYRDGGMFNLVQLGFFFVQDKNCAIVLTSQTVWAPNVWGE